MSFNGSRLARWPTFIDDKTVAKMGHPNLWWGQTWATRRTRTEVAANPTLREFAHRCPGRRLGSMEQELNQAIELHDTECLAVEIDDQGCGSVLLDAYVHRTVGEPGISPGEGGVQRIRIKMGAMTIKGEVGPLPPYVYEGSLTVGSTVQDNMVPFPASSPETAALTMMLSDDARIVVVSGVTISIEAESGFRFVEPVDFTSR
jgi:hypothetical protein